MTSESPYQVYGQQADKYLQFIAEYHGKSRKHTWEELSDRWLGAVPDLTPQDFNFLMKRGSMKLGNWHTKLGQHVEVLLNATVAERIFV